jgi:pimeloyl-ACP methyl ester carboxylesterase
MIGLRACWAVHSPVGCKVTPRIAPAGVLAGQSEDQGNDHHHRTAARATLPVLLILGSASPAWAHDITGELAAGLPESILAVLDGQGHDAIDSAPELLASELAGFFRY